MENFVGKIKSIIPDNNLEIALYILLFVTVVWASLELFYYISKNNIVANSLKHFYEKTEADKEERLRLEKMQKIESGNIDDERWLLKLDKTIEYSNIKKYIPFLNSTIFIFLLVMCSSIAVIIGSLFFDFITTLILLFAVIMTFVVVLLGMTSINYRRTENGVVTFMNLVENYSKTSNDLITIMGKIYVYLDEPLRTHVQDCYYLGQRTGDADLALETLQNSVNHKKFKEIIRNLIICSHYEANYEDVIEDSREMLIEYLAGKRARAVMARNAKIEMGILLAVSIVVFMMMGSFLEASIIEMLSMNIIGKAILIYLVGLLAIIGYNMLFLGRSKD